MFTTTACPKCHASEFTCVRCGGLGYIYLKDLTEREREILHRDGVWIDRSGDQIRITEMSDDRLKSVYAFIKRRADQDKQRVVSNLEMQVCLYGDSAGIDSGAWLREIKSGKFWQTPTQYDEDSVSLYDHPIYEQLISELYRRHVDFEP